MRQLKNILRKHPFSICFSLSQHYINLKTFHIVSSPCNCLLRCTRCSLLVEIHSLLVACCKITCYSLQNLLVTRCRSCLYQKITRYSFQNLLAARFRSGATCCMFMKMKLHHRCFPVNFCKTLRTLILWNIYERLLLKIISKHQQTFYSFLRKVFHFHLIKFDQGRLIGRLI